MGGGWFKIRAPLVQEFILEFFSTCRIGLHNAEEMAVDEFGPYWLRSERVIPNKGGLSDYWVEISSSRDFLRGAPSYTYIRIRFGGCATGMMRGGRAVPGYMEDILLGFLLITLVWDDRYDWALGCPGPRGRQADLAPVQAPQPPLPPPAVGRPMPQRLGRLKEEMQGLQHDVRSLCGLVERSMTDRGRFSTWMISCMTQLMDASGQTYQAFDGAIRGSSPAVFEKRTRKRTKDAITSTSPQ
ncbi:hypothetical protein Tco_0529637 [Tanacetum coccineum]